MAPTLYDLCKRYIAAVDNLENHPENAHGADDRDITEALLIEWVDARAFVGHTRVRFTSTPPEVYDF